MLGSIADESLSALREVGIESTEQLASANPSQLADALERDESVVAEWVEEAKQASGTTSRPAFMETRNGKRIRTRYEQITSAVRTAISAPTAPVETVRSVIDVVSKYATLAAGWLLRDIPGTLNGGVERARSFFDRLPARVSTLMHGPGGDLESIDGIGPAYSDRLVQEGISDVAVLAACSPERLSERVDIFPRRTYRWIVQATAETPDTPGLRQRLFAGVVRVEALYISVRTARPISVESTRLRGNRLSSRPLSDRGVSQLTAVGIASVSQLAAADPDRLAAGVGIDTKTARAWIETARRYQERVINGRRGP